MKINASEKQKNEIHYKLVLGAVNRASSVALFFAVAFIIFGFTSLEILQSFDPEITLWSNTWPRIALNGIPFFLFYLSFKNYKKNPVLKLWVWCICFPLIFVSTCWIHVWPLMLAGHPNLYLYVHAANYLVIIMSMTLVAPPPRYLLAITLGLMSFFVAPMCYIFYSLHEFTLMTFFINDSAYGLLLSGLSAYMNYSVRNKLATEDVVNKRKIEKFVGNLISESIFENNEALLQARTTNAYLMSLDIRGFTRLTQNAGASSSLFKEKYHALVASVVGQQGGFIHKTHGDGHLVSLGLFNTDVELDDIPGIKDDLQKAEARRQKQLLNKAITIYEKILHEFSVIKAELKVETEVAVCASIDFGEIGLKILGDPNVRLEFDIEGLVVIRCSRLEAYTKTLRQVLSPTSSFLIISKAAMQNLDDEFSFESFLTAQDPVKDFPSESVVYYRKYLQRNIGKRFAA